MLTNCFSSGLADGRFKVYSTPVCLAQKSLTACNSAQSYVSVVMRHVKLDANLLGLLPHSFNQCLELVLA